MKKPLIFGNGWLGKLLGDYFQCEVSSVDITNDRYPEDEVDRVCPSFVINAAAKTDPCWCSKNTEAAFQNNVIGPENLAGILDRKRIPFVHLSTGMLFGDVAIATEDTTTTPRDGYAYTKKMAEEYLIPYDPLIIRLHLPIDDVPHKRNLITKLASFPSIADLSTSITVVSSLCMAIELLVKKKCKGIYNVVNNPPVAYKDLMRWYTEIVDNNFKFNLVPISDLVSKGLMQPTSAIFLLSTSKLVSAGIILPDSKTAIQECLKKYKMHL